MDFYQIKEREGSKKGVLEVYPDFRVTRSKDLMVQGRQFYAIWDEARGLWSTDEYDVQRLIDEEIRDYEVQTPGLFEVKRKYLGDFSTNSWMQFRNFVSHISDSSQPLDRTLTFSNTEVKQSDYASKRLPYPLSAGSIASYDEMIGTLYDPEEREKIEWVIGAIVSGDSKTIQKFLVFYGKGGTGKSTIIDIIEKLFVGYTSKFDAKALTSGNNAFATEAFKDNPLVAIEHDGDLSKIEDNSKLNSIVAHESMRVNEKYKPSYDAHADAFCIMGTNKPVKITDAKSGIIRRMIDVRPSERLLAPRKYQALKSQIDFELGAIAQHCLDVYLSLGRDYFSMYMPVEMMLQTDVFFNFIEAHYDIFKEQPGVSLDQAYALYTQFISDSGIEYALPKYKLREELKNYFNKFEERIIIDDVRIRSWYTEFNADHFKTKVGKQEQVFSLVMQETESLVDDILAECPAQYATDEGNPTKSWDSVTTTLWDIDTSQEHYVRVPENHIVIDFDLKDEHGVKSAQRNLEAASQWPSTYAEFSRGGGGVHLHYIYEGDVTELSRVYEEGIEVKVYTGKAALRRKLSKCNSVPVAVISSGLPLREKKVINQETVKSEKALRELVMRNLRKEIHPGTKPSIDFIHKILEEAYTSGLTYDLTDLRPRIQVFANNSTNQALHCLKMVQSMMFRSDSKDEILSKDPTPSQLADERLVFFDVEVFPNLFIVSWKYQGEANVVRMVNPTPPEIENLLSLKLVGFNNRKYDNHILYARLMGYDNTELYRLSQRIIESSPNAMFAEAYNLSYTDIYDFSSKKQSLKKFQIELGLSHKELGLPWDEPVEQKLWGKVGDYCDNDVITTEQVFNDRSGDFVARQILADLSGLSINASTQQHASRIVFGADIRPQEKFEYTDLSETFPGYEYSFGKSTYRGEITGEGGYVYAEPGMYENVALLDVTSMHPTSIEALNLFGEYTKNFSALKAARIAIKHGDYELAKGMLGGKLARHLGDVNQAQALSDALKIAINIVYGLTSAKFDNSFRDPRNIDNIVAKRGALFMVDLKNEVQARGFTVAHIKTDSIKIPNATQEIIDFIFEFGTKYGYTFEHEATYEKMCLVNDAVYIAKVGPGSKKEGQWIATGAQFQHPYVYKTLFSKEPLTFRDHCEAKMVTTALYLDFEGVDLDIPMVFQQERKQFIGKAGLFCPIQESKGGGLLMRIKDDKFYAATGTKGYRWLESETVKEFNLQENIDDGYFKKLVDESVATISKYGDFEWFVS